MTIDEATLDRMDELTSSSERYSSRSAFVRAALSWYVARERQLLDEDRERRIVRKHK